VDAGPYRVALPEFEGPLDLLLHLCKTHEIDIVTLPVAFITEKYLEYLDLMQSMPFDVAADYLVMAATLAYLKSRELVPTPEPLDVGPEEEGEVLDPREELIRRLLEYQKYKDAAEKLGGRPIEGRNVFGRGMSLSNDAPDAPFAEQSVWKLIAAFGRILEKAGGTKKTHEVAIDRVSIGDRMGQLLDRIEKGSGSFQFESCFDLSLPEVELRNQVVVTLLAILELARLKVVRVLQSPDGDTLFITQAAGVTMESARQAAMTAGETKQVPVDENTDEDAQEDPQEDAQEDAQEDPQEGENSAGAPSNEMRAETFDETLDDPLAEGSDETLEEILAGLPEEVLADKSDETVGDDVPETAEEVVRQTVPTVQTVEDKPEEMLEEKNEQT
jgi:segregation and condensation protein A